MTVSTALRVCRASSPRGTATLALQRRQWLSSAPPKTGPTATYVSQEALEAARAKQHKAKVSTAIRRTRDGVYIILAIAGSVVLCVLGYTLLQARFSSQSEYNVFAKASDIVMASPEVQRVLGPSMRCRGEPSRGRGSSHGGFRNIKSTDEEGLRSVSIVFYCEGNGKRGVVRAAMKETHGSSLFNPFVFTQLDVEVPGQRGRIKLLKAATQRSRNQ